MLRSSVLWHHAYIKVSQEKLTASSGVKSLTAAEVVEVVPRAASVSTASAPP